MFLAGIRGVVRRLGFDIIRYSLSASRDARLLQQLRHHRITGVLDVGANRGQYAHDLFRSGYAGHVVSFEALGAPHAVLLQQAQGKPRWQIAPQAAIGAETGTIQMQVAGNEVSSSALPVLDLHTGAAPTSATVRTEQVPLVRLDDAAAPYCQPHDRLFLKIDTQGYEWQVLQGAPHLLSLAIGVQLELSLVPLYQDQMLMPTLMEFLTARGFQLWGLTPGFTDPRTGQMLQVDGVFFRA